MSWSESFSNLTYDEVDALKPKNANTDPGQFEACLGALVELIDTGCIGDRSKIKFSGSLVGHANENHNPLPGWSPDFVNISLSQVREPSALDKAANG